MSQLDTWVFRDNCQVDLIPVVRLVFAGKEPLFLCGISTHVCHQCKLLCNLRGDRYNFRCGINPILVYLSILTKTGWGLKLNPRSELYH